MYSDERETKRKDLGGGICGRSWGRGIITRIYMYKYIIFSIKDYILGLVSVDHPDPT